MDQQENGVIYVEYPSEAKLQAMLTELNARGLELHSVVPKIGTTVVGLPQTEGLWIFWRKIG